MVTNAMQQLNGKDELFSGYFSWFTEVKPVTCRVRQATNSSDHQVAVVYPDDILHFHVVSPTMITPMMMNNMIGNHDNDDDNW